MNELQDYADLSATELAATVSSLARRTNAEGKCIIPTKLHKNIKALCFWARERVRQQLALDANGFHNDVMLETKALMKLRDENAAAAPSIKPAKFTAAAWHDWHTAFISFLSNYKGTQLAELDYITREHTVLPANHVHLSTRDSDLYKFPLTGPYFEEDNRTVYRMLEDLMNGTEGYTGSRCITAPKRVERPGLALPTTTTVEGNRKKLLHAQKPLSSQRTTRMNKFSHLRRLPHASSVHTAI